MAATNKVVRIAVDAMGGDHAPKEIVSGAVDAARNGGVQILLVGDAERVRVVGQKTFGPDDADVCRTERAQGLVEAVKHGAIADATYLDGLEADLPALLDGDADLTTRAVLRSVAIKAQVVSEDERESGLREILNFGHTLGHAIEAASSYDVSHGTAIGYGMVLEARIGTELGVTAKDTLERIKEVVEEVGLLRRSPVEASSADIMSYLTLDKKVRDGRTLFVLLSHIGSVYFARDSWSHPVQDQIVRDAVDYFVTNLR